MNHQEFPVFATPNGVSMMCACMLCVLLDFAVLGGQSCSQPERTREGRKAR